MFQHCINRHFKYTQEVKSFVERTGTHWFLDMVALELFKLQDNGDVFIILEVSNRKAKITAESGGVVKTKLLEFTSCPAGVWKFSVTNDVMEGIK